MKHVNKVWNCSGEDPQMESFYMKELFICWLLAFQFTLMQNTSNYILSVTPIYRVSHKKFLIKIYLNITKITFWERPVCFIFVYYYSCEARNVIAKYSVSWPPVSALSASHQAVSQVSGEDELLLHPGALHPHHLLLSLHFPMACLQMRLGPSWQYLIILKVK